MHLANASSGERSCAIFARSPSFLSATPHLLERPGGKTRRLHVTEEVLREDEGPAILQAEGGREREKQAGRQAGQIRESGEKGRSQFALKLAAKRDSRLTRRGVSFVPLGRGRKKMSPIARPFC